MTDQEKYQQAVEDGETLCVKYLELAKCRDDYTPIMIARELVPLFLSLKGDWGRVAVVREKAELPENLYSEHETISPHWVCEATQSDMLNAGFVQEIKENKE